MQNVGHNHPDIVWKKPDGTQRIVEVCCPCDKNVREWVEKKYSIYRPLKNDFERNRGIPTEIVPTVVGNTSLIAEELEDDLVLHFGLPISLIPRLQRIALYETVNSIKSMLTRDWAPGRGGGHQPRTEEKIVCNVIS